MIRPLRSLLLWHDEGGARRGHRRRHPRGSRATTATTVAACVGTRQAAGKKEGRGRSRSDGGPCDGQQQRLSVCSPALLLPAERHPAAAGQQQQRRRPLLFLVLGPASTCLLLLPITDTTRYFWSSYNSTHSSRKKKSPPTTRTTRRARGSCFSRHATSLLLHTLYYQPTAGGEPCS